MYENENDINLDKKNILTNNIENFNKSEDNNNKEENRISENSDVERSKETFNIIKYAGRCFQRLLLCFHACDACLFHFYKRINPCCCIYAGRGSAKRYCHKTSRF